MSLTQTQLESRRNYIGASEVPVLFGENKYVTAFDLWAYKTGRVNENPLESEAAEVGILLEDFVLNYAEQKLGKLRRNQQRVAESGIVRATLDAQLVETKEPVEAKTTGILGTPYGDWGEDGSDDIPNWTILQTQTQIMCVNKIHPDVSVCHVPALIGRRGRALFRVERNEEIIEAIKRRTDEFWNSVVKDIPPVDVPMSLGVAGRLKSIEGEDKQLDPDLISEFAILQFKHKQAKDELDIIKAKVLSTMDSAELGMIDSVLALTANSQDRKTYKYVGDDFDRDHEKKVTTFRKLLLKKGFKHNG